MPKNTSLSHDDSLTAGGVITQPSSPDLPKEDFSNPTTRNQREVNERNCRNKGGGIGYNYDD
ncbi:MAG TPA: hypothetical protein VHP58_02750 [Alphaproteobacteria bacterium]|nr:hypothetical protein [Alphaproteobacteria bacterium]